MWSVCTRRREASTAARMCLRELPASKRAGPVGAKHLVATMKRSRFPRSQRPRISSVTPGGEIPAQRVGVGGVEEVNTALGRPVENGDSGGLIALQPEGHRPEAQPRNLEAGPAESGVFHGRTLPARSGDGAFAPSEKVPSWHTSRHYADVSGVASTGDSLSASHVTSG